MHVKSQKTKRPKVYPDLGPKNAAGLDRFEITESGGVHQQISTAIGSKSGKADPLANVE